MQIAHTSHCAIHNTCTVLYCIGLDASKWMSLDKLDNFTAGGSTNCSLETEDLTFRQINEQSLIRAQIFNKMQCIYHCILSTPLSRAWSRLSKSVSMVVTSLEQNIIGPSWTKLTVSLNDPYFYNTLQCEPCIYSWKSIYAEIMLAMLVPLLL